MKYIKKKINHIDIEESRSFIVFFLYNRKDKYKKDSDLSYFNYLSKLVKWGALNFLTMNFKILKNEVSFENEISKNRNKRIFSYEQNFMRRVEEYEIKKKLKEFNEETEKVYILLQQNMKLYQIEKELKITGWNINKILKDIRKILREYNGK